MQLKYFGTTSNTLTKRPKYILANVDVYLNGDVEVSIDKSKEVEVLKLIEERTNLMEDFNVCSDGEILLLKNKIEITREERDNEVQKLLHKHFEHSVFADGQHYLNLNTIRLPQVLSYYGILYILCSIVRYKPEQLSGMLANNETSMRWFMNKLCETIERVYPNLMLNLIYSSNLCFKNY